MAALPKPFPLIARLRYEYRAGDETLPVIENAWWESRFDGGSALGAVVEAMAAPRHPHRLRVQLRFRRDGRPREMEITLLRPDGEGRAAYRFVEDAVRATGAWNGVDFSETTRMPRAYTVAPHCLAADGLHFPSASAIGATTMHFCYLIDPRRSDNPLVGSAVGFTSEYLGDESIEIDGRPVEARRFRATYHDAADAAADFWVEPAGFALRMVSKRSDGTPYEIVCTRFAES